MDKPLIKLYLILTASIALVVVFIPTIAYRTSAWTENTMAEAELLLYNAEGVVPVKQDPAKGNIVIIMDDGWKTQYTAGYQILKNAGLKANIAVIPAAVGTEGYMSYKQLADLYKEGWDMLNHTYNHADLSSLSKEQQTQQIIKGREWLIGHQLERGSDILVYPGGRFSDVTINLLSDTGVAAARSLKSVWVTDIDCTLEDAEICNMVNDITVNMVQSALDKAADNRSTVIILLHKIEPVTDDLGMQLEVENFKEIAALILNYRDQLNVITMSELIELENEKLVDNSAQAFNR
jgi:peptidoglycan/xylan/chitin deacetylase (PgdA/CDA1 family)